MAASTLQRMGAAMDLGMNVGARSLSPQEQDEQLKRKKLLQQQQQARMAPFQGAYMSLTGNQY